MAAEKGVIGIFALGILALMAYLFQDMPKPMTNVDPVKDAIEKGIVTPLGLPAVALTALWVQSKLETGAWKSKSFLATRSLFNRHAGSGRGEWLGAGLPKTSWKLGVHLYYANPGDADLRIYKDVYQSARDMAQLLQDGLYRAALAELRRGNPAGYFREVAAAGFAADPSYAQNLLRNFQAVA